MEKFFHNIPDSLTKENRLANVRLGEIPMDRGKIYLVSSDPIMRNYLRSYISHFDHKVLTPAKPENFWDDLKALSPSLVIYDLWKNNSGTVQNLQNLIQLEKTIPVILLAGEMQLPMIQELEGSDQWKVIKKPFLPQDLKTSILEALGKEREIVLTPAQVLRPSFTNTKKGYHPQLLLESSQRMQDVRAVIDHVANTDVTILIRGESGTGKELAARSIFESSNRASKPFITVLCPAIPEGLLESELFGYEKGSFTGAFRRRPGKFEIANHGTIFLDEIGDIPFELQSKLLHVLQRGEFALIGGNEQKVDVRILAATNKDLEKAVAEGMFREDLYYRLNVVSIFLPPLRERREDIPVLIECFFQKYNEQYNKEYHELTASTMRLLLDYDWPGNVRELENLIKRVVIMGNPDTLVHNYLNENVKKIKPRLAQNRPAPTDPLPLPAGRPRDSAAAPSALRSLKEVAREAMRKAEGEAILKALEQTHWNRKAAARILEISYKALLYKIRQCNLDGEPDSSTPDP